MGRPGPERLSAEELRRRGSRRGPEREKAAREAAQVKAQRRKGRRVTAADMLAVVSLIPGYDPYRDSQGYTFDARTAAKVVNFFHQKLSHVKGEWAGKAFVLGPWEQAIIANVYGWKAPDGTRRYREVFLFVPRKNGKTTLAAGLINYALFEDREPGAEIYCAASDRDQASLVYSQAVQMVRQEPDLAARVKEYVASKTVTFPESNSFYRAISAESKTKHGYNTHTAVIDELHAQPNRDLVDVLETSTGSRRQPLIFHITTSDYDRPSICNEKHDYALKVRDGVIDDPTFLPIIYEATLEDDWTSEEVWRRVNPNYGVSLKSAYFRRKFRKAQEEITFENTFKRLHLNIKTEQATRWLSLEQWDSCGGAVVPEALYGQPCYAGLDLASTRDLCALVLVFPENENAVLPFFWVPADNAHARERRDRVPYETWAREGWIELTPGNATDYDAIEARVLAVAEKYDIRQLAIDRWNSAQITTHLTDAGLDVVLFGQGYASMAYPMKELEKMVLRGGMRHGGHPVLRWNASNVAVTHKRDAADNIKPDKDKSRDKIDGIVALVMAIGLMMAGVGEAATSVYETRGVLTL